MPTIHLKRDTKRRLEEIMMAELRATILSGNAKSILTNSKLGVGYSVMIDKMIKVYKGMNHNHKK